MKHYNILDELNVATINDQNDLRRVVYDFLQKNHKAVYDHTDRLRIILGDHDYYSTDVGDKLSIIQTACDEIDISRCFVEVASTNPELESEASKIAKSTDESQRLSCMVIDGEYSKIANDQPTYSYSSQIPTKINLKDLSDRETHWLTESKTFCMYPWIHLNASPNGEAMPCCLWDYTVPMGSTKENTIQELWNNDKWKELRTSMIEGREHPGCVKCYGQEKAGFFSNRQSANKHHGHHIKRVSDTRPDGTSDIFQLTYWDIRFSNLCNLSCRSCGHIFSSSWYQDQVRLAGQEWGRNNKALFWAGRHETDMLEQLMQHIDYVEQVYFAGGEPLMMEEHYQILEELERQKKFNVRLVYNTNFTKTKLKDRYVFDYWRKFDSVGVGASLDAMGPRAEYIRKGTKWSDVERNRRMMMEQCPDVDFYISPTLSIQNALHLPDFHREWVDKGLLRPQDLNVNLLQDPRWLRADIATPGYKKKIVEKYQKHLEWLKPQDPLQRATQGFESAIRFIESEDRSDLLPEFWERMAQLDEFRKENLLEVIPELHELAQ